MARTIAIALLAALSAACVQLPRAELQAYRDAFTAAQTAATPLVADYAISERALRQSVLETDSARNFRQRSYFPTFEVSDAAALSSIGSPPGAAALERGFNGIAGYNDTLVALAENKNIDVARAQLGQMIDDLAGIAPPLAAAQAPAQGVAGLLVEALRPAIAADNAREFRRIVLEGYPLVVRLIGELRDFTPTQYSTTTRLLQERWVTEQQNRADIAQQINTWHRAYADYVVLLNAMERSLATLKTAVETPRQRPLLDQASTATADLRTYADALRRSIAAIRAPR